MQYCHFGGVKEIRRPPDGYIIFGRKWRWKLGAKFATEKSTQKKQLSLLIRFVGLSSILQ